LYSIEQRPMWFTFRWKWSVAGKFSNLPRPIKVQYSPCAPCKPIYV